jgi:hypothetical protein
VGEGDDDGDGLAVGEGLGGGDGLTEGAGAGDTDGLGDGDVVGLGLGLCADVVVAEVFADVPPEPACRLTGTQAEMAMRPVKARPAVASLARRRSTGVSLMVGISEPSKI